MVEDVMQSLGVMQHFRSTVNHHSCLSLWLSMQGSANKEAERWNEPVKNGVSLGIGIIQS